MSRITPACAGNRRWDVLVNDGTPDHPRLRGEQGPPRACESRRIGSPPLARGTVPPSLYVLAADGITPACAGNSFKIYFGEQRVKDHPRLRGEQKNSGVRKHGQVGSPPLARGTGNFRNRHIGILGITPACAGNSTKDAASNRRGKDHPRLRGEQIQHCFPLLYHSGSPPLARGTGAGNSAERREGWITPACAGNSERRGH